MTSAVHTRGATLAAAVTALACASVLLAGCGGSTAAVVGSPTGQSWRSSLSADERSQATAALVKRSQLPELSSSTKPVSISDLAADADLADLPATLARLGYRGGVQRVFRGASSSVTSADSRVLVFGSADDATGYTTYVHDHAGAFFGDPTVVTAWPASGPASWQFTPPLCACHRAEPLYAAVVQDGATVRWLQINGPTASARQVRTLLSAPAG